MGRKRSREIYRENPKDSGKLRDQLRALCAAVFVVIASAPSYF